MGIRTFDLLSASVSVFGISGLDQLLCFMIVKELQQFVTQLRREVRNIQSPYILKTRIHLTLFFPSVLSDNKRDARADQWYFIHLVPSIYDPSTTTQSISSGSNPNSQTMESLLRYSIDLFPFNQSSIYSFILAEKMIAISFYILIS